MLADRDQPSSDSGAVRSNGCEYSDESGTRRGLAGGLVLTGRAPMRTRLSTTLPIGTEYELLRTDWRREGPESDAAFLGSAAAGGGDVRRCRDTEPQGRDGDILIGAPRSYKESSAKTIT